MSKKRLFRQILALITVLLLTLSTVSTAFAETTSTTVNPKTVYAQINGVTVAIDFQQLWDAYANDNTAYQTTWKSAKILGIVMPDGTTLAWDAFWDALAANEVQTVVDYANKAGHVAYTVPTDCALVDANGVVGPVAHNPNVPVALAVSSVTPVGAKKLQVNFSVAVDDTKASFAVTKGAATVNVASVAFAADKKSAVLTLATKLTAGDYAVKVSGLSTTALTGTAVGVKAETATTIQLLADKAAGVLSSGNYTTATISYAVYNQYGEDITTIAPAINWTSTVGTPTDNDAGVLTITVSSVPYLTIGQSVTLIGVIPSTGAIVNTTIAVGTPATVDSIAFDKLYNADGKTLYTNSTYANFVVTFSALDQYGNELTHTQVNNDMYIISTNPAIFTVAASTPVLTAQGAKADQLGIALAAPTTPLAGTASIRMISKTTGKSFEFPVTVTKAATVDTFAFSAPATTVAAGETVKIPFTAEDQNGAAITSFAGLNGLVTFPTNGGVSGSLAFANDYVNKVAVLNYTAPSTAGTYILMALTPSGKTAQLTMEVKAGPVAGWVSGLDSTVVTNLAVNGQLTLTKDSFVVKDNYGRDFDITTKLSAHTASGDLVTADLGKYEIVVSKSSSTNAYTSLTGTEINGQTGHTTEVVTGAKAGTTTYVAKIKKVIETATAGVYDWQDVAGSEFTFNVAVTDKTNVASYELKAIPTLYDEAGTPSGLTATDYDVTLKVYGVMADGSKVTLPTSDYTVMTTDSHLTYASGKLTANGLTTYATGENTTTATVLVTVNAADTAVLLSQVVTVSKVAPKVTTLALDEDYINYESAGLISVALPATADDLTLNALKTVTENAVIATDQYGVELPDTGLYTLVLTNLPNNASGVAKTLNGYNGASATTLQKGDVFTVTALTSNGTPIQFKVVLK